MAEWHFYASGPDKANEKIASQKDSLSSSATSKAKEEAKSAIDSVNMDGLTDEMKSALKRPLIITLV